MLLDLLDPDPDSLVRNMDPDPDSALDPKTSIIQKSKKNLNSYYSVTPFDLLSLKNDVHVFLKSNKQKILCKKYFFLLLS